MKDRIQKASPRQATAQPKWYTRHKGALAATLAAIAALFILYLPALQGDFIFDDISLPLRLSAYQQPLSVWLNGLRPVLMLSYWLNGKVLGDAPSSYHLVNLLIHLLNGALVFLVLRRLVRMAEWPQDRARFAAAIGAAIFLVHPLQTESVSYIAGRSESLAAFLVLLAYTLFLYRRRESISWMEAIAVLLLFGLAIKTKENAISLAGVLILTDIWWPNAFSLDGLKKNWKLYLLMLPGAVFAVVVVLRMLASAGTAGFSITTFRWYQYAFTEVRAIFTYVRLAILPVGQSLDHDFATSHTILEHGALIYMLVLGGLVAAAVRFRRQYPLACFGFLMFLVWLAPTSSIIPIDDAVVERRMYLALMGLILIACEAVGRAKWSRSTVCALAATLLVVFGGFCYARNRMWGRPETLLAQSALEAQHNPRPLLNLSELLIRQNRCDAAIPFLERAEKILPNSYHVHASWGRTLACLGHLEEGMQRLQIAARIQPCSQVYQWIGLVYGQMGRLADAGDAFQKSVQMDENSASAHGSLALWYEKVRDFNSAEREYEISVALDPEDWTARYGLLRLNQLKNGQTPEPRRGFQP